MNEDQQQNSQVPKSSEPFGSVPKPSEAFGTFPQSSESFGTVRKASEEPDKRLHFVERKANHTLTVKEVARMFESAGVARTERSIINWCQLNRMGVARLDAYFDPNEHKYFITPESVNAAIQEEISRAAKQADQTPAVEGIPKPSETVKEEKAPLPGGQETDELKALRQENMDLKIMNRGKDYFIEQLQKEREGYVQQLVTSSRKIGELETKLLALEAPKSAGQPGTGSAEPA